MELRRRVETDGCIAVLEFVPSIEPPDNMRDAQWDGEQV